MAKFILLSISFLIILYGYSQPKEFDKYYIQNKSILLNKIAKQSDKVGQKISVEFDKLGRKTKWYYPKSDTTLFLYSYSRDTVICTICHSRYDTTGPPFQVEKYLYNKNGKILFYSSIESNPEDFKKTKITISKFTYNDKDNIVALHEYLNYNYPYSVIKNYPIVDSLLVLANRNTYSYNSFGEIAAKNQISGNEDFRTVDSFFYTNNKKIQKRTSFVKKGYIGEKQFSNIYNIDEFNYTKNSVVIIEKTKYDDSLKGTILQFDTSFEEVKYRSGLVNKIYLIDQNGDKSLVALYVYEHRK